MSMSLKKNPMEILAFYKLQRSGLDIEYKLKSVFSFLPLMVEFRKIVDVYVIK